MTVKGGNTDDLYQGDGRLKMAQALTDAWPGIVTVKRRWGRPQHVVQDAWRRFQTPLKRRADLDWAALPAVNEYGLELKAIAPVQSPDLQQLLMDYQARKAQLQE